MCLYGYKFETITIKGTPVDQSSCNSFSELIHGNQICKTVLESVGEDKRSTYSKKSVGEDIVCCYLNELDLTCGRKPFPNTDINPTDLNHIT